MMTQAVATNNPRYRKLREDLMQRILQGQPGARLPSTRRLMQKHNVSQLLVDRCYFDLETQGLLDRRHRFGVFISDRARKEYKRARVIGFLTTQPGNVDARQFASGLEQACQPDKSLLLRFDGMELLAKNLEEARESSRAELDGLVCWMDPTQPRDVLSSLQTLMSYFRLKIVLAGRSDTPLYADHVELDWREIIERILQKQKIPNMAPLLLLYASGSESVAVQIESELKRHGVGVTKNNMDDNTVALRAEQRMVLIGPEAQDIARIVPWQVDGETGRYIAISYQIHDVHSGGNLQYAVLPYEQMGRESYHLLCNRLKEGDAWFPRVLSFSAFWERHLHG